MMFCTKVFKKMKAIAFILFGSICFQNIANAGVISGTNNQFKYICFPNSIIAYLDNNQNDSTDWLCAKFKKRSTGEVCFQFFRRCVRGEISLTSAIRQPSFTANLGLLFSFGSHDSLILKDFEIVEKEDKVIYCSFSCIFREHKYKINFSYEDRKVKFDSEAGLELEFVVEPDNYYLAQIISLGVSMVLEEITVNI
jgi:hypothetical protein